MVLTLDNPWRGIGLLPNAPRPRTDVGAVARLLALCPKHRQTPLRSLAPLAAKTGVAQVIAKDERQRMGLGSFKALGAAFAIAREADKQRISDWEDALAGRVFAAASAGNHGLSVAAGARIFGAKAIIYIAEPVPQAFADRLTSLGAVVTRAGENYEASMLAAAQDAALNGWQLLSDSTWEGYTDPAMDVMEGYLQLAAETAEQIDEPPTHILLQAGVGGMAAALAAYARRQWRDVPQIFVVEPAHAPALFESIRAGKLVETSGPPSAMGRLDCKTASVVALAGLSHDADVFVTITEEEVYQALPSLDDLGVSTTPSGAAGLAALLAGLDLPSNARVLTILSEGPVDA